MGKWLPVILILGAVLAFAWWKKKAADAATIAAINVNETATPETIAAINKQAAANKEAAANKAALLAQLGIKTSTDQVKALVETPISGTKIVSNTVVTTANKTPAEKAAEVNANVDLVTKATANAAAAQALLGLTATQTTAVINADKVKAAAAAATATVSPSIVPTPTPTPALTCDPVTLARIQAAVNAAMATPGVSFSF